MTCSAMASGMRSTAPTELKVRSESEGRSLVVRHGQSRRLEPAVSRLPSSHVKVEDHRADLTDGRVELVDDVPRRERSSVRARCRPSGDHPRGEEALDHEVVEVTGSHTLAFLQASACSCCVLMLLGFRGEPFADVPGDFRVHAGSAVTRADDLEHDLRGDVRPRRGVGVS